MWEVNDDNVFTFFFSRVQKVKSKKQKDKRGALHKMEIIIIEGDACFEEIVQLLNKVELLLNSLLLGT